jgi:hypothetical protein
MRESTYQSKLIGKIERLLPGCHIQKNSTDFQQGLPDLLVLHGKRWAMLEVKRDQFAPQQPNQSYYIDRFRGMGFAAFIYPENEEEVLSALQSALSD